MRLAARRKHGAHRCAPPGSPSSRGLRWRPRSAPPFQRAAPSSTSPETSASRGSRARAWAPTTSSGSRILARARTPRRSTAGGSARDEAPEAPPRKRGRGQRTRPRASIAVVLARPAAAVAYPGYRQPDLEHRTRTFLTGAALLHAAGIAVLFALASLAPQIQDHILRLQILQPP